MSDYAVIIPAFNAARTIRQAVSSALEQSLPPSAVIVVDDGSTDDTAAVAGSLPGVRLVLQANAGPGAARNRGASQCSSAWLAFLDADDTWLPDKMERQLGAGVDPGIGVVHGREPAEPRPAPPLVGFADLWEANCITLSAAVVRRAAFDRVGGFDEDRALISVEDYHLWLRIAASGWGIATQAGSFVRYTPAPASLSSDARRFAAAHFHNARAIGAALHLPAGQVEAKLQAYRVAFGGDLFWRRDLAGARRLLAAACWRRPSLGLGLQVLATFCPRPILDWRRPRAAVHGAVGRPG